MGIGSASEMTSSADYTNSFRSDDLFKNGRGFEVDRVEGGRKRLTHSVDAFKIDTTHSKIKKKKPNSDTKTCSITFEVL